MRTIPSSPRKPEAGVETVRGAPVDWSHLAEDYARLRNAHEVAKLYHCRYTAVRAEMDHQGISLLSRKGEKKSDEWRAKQRRTNWDNPEWRAKQRARWLEGLPTMRGPSANSPLERLLQGALLKAGISFSTQRVLLGKYMVDILVDQLPVVIEADGRTHLLKAEADRLRDADLVTAGYQVFRFKGGPINRDPDGCVWQVIETSGLMADAEPRADIRNGRLGPDNNKWTGGKLEWTCETCGKVFEAYRRCGQPRRTCSRECQRLWQKAHPSKRWADPEARAKWSEQLRSQWADPELGERRRVAQQKAAAGAKAHWEARRQEKAAQQAMRQSEPT